MEDKICHESVSLRHIGKHPNIGGVKKKYIK